MQSIVDIKYIILIDGSAYCEMYETMFDDIVKYNNVTVMVEDSKLGLVEKILLKEKIRKIIGKKLDFISNEETALYKEIQASCIEYDRVRILMSNAALYYRPYFANQLLKYKEIYSNLKIMLLYLDIVDTGVSKDANRLRDEGIFDRVYTVDPEDARKYNMRFIWTPYSQMGALHTAKMYDLFFCGASKKRIDLLSEILSFCNSRHVSRKMIITAYEDTSKIDHYEGVWIKPPGSIIGYRQQLEEGLKSNCILEIVQKNQTALTIRPFEAICYNKKLLTNNRTILSFPYYDQKYMQYFERVDDIDWDWVKEKDDVEYNYKGDFSPKYLLYELV